MDETFNNPVDQCVLSHELIELIEWLVKHKEHELRQLVSEALTQGLAQRLKKSSTIRDLERAQGSILDFFDLLEGSLIQAVDDHEMTDLMERSMLPQLRQVDISACDLSTVQSSAAAVRLKMKKKSTKKSAQQLFYEELLKQWEPVMSEGPQE